MKKPIIILILSIVFSCGNNSENKDFDFTLTFERSEGKETATYDEVIEFYTRLSEKHTSIAMYEMGKTDSGKPLHLVTFNPNRSFESEFSGDDEKIIMLINNGIHPGESDGIDASMMLLRDLAEAKIPAPANVIVAVIPVYNIGGALNRNSTTRTNQNGPKSYGFRGNARNYDLNRDFIKADTRNARAFIDLFRTVKPDLFIDTHVSNGADYQYTLTHLFTQHNKLGGVLGDYLENTFRPRLEDSLQKRNWEITPYVNVFNRKPESGFSQFLDGARYSTGYTSLYNTLGMMIETHMLKPYKDRVEGTYALLNEFISIADSDWEVILNLRKAANSSYQVGDLYPLSWTIDSTRTSTLNFKGYEAAMIPSKVTGAQRLQYDRNRPYEREITYYNHFKPASSVTIPKQYIISGGYWNVVELLRLNKIRCDYVKKDTVVSAEVYYIESYDTSPNAYEGHYPHYNTLVRVENEEIQVHAGDYIVETNQPGIRYLLETLEPTAPDSFFNWNYFDAILQQKEGFSPYVWEDMAYQFLQDNPEIKEAFENKKLEDANFRNNWYAQLDWIHKKSPNYEKAHLRYPVVRVSE